MQDTNSSALLEGPFYYGWFWFFAATALFAAMAGIVVFILYSTRKREVKTLSNIKQLQPHVIDMNALKDKYSRLIAEVEKKYNEGKLKSSQAHQELSMLVRLFFCEAMGFHAEVMTLGDLKKTNYTKLANLIDQYYPDEFDTLENGAVSQSIERAREIVRNQ